LCQDGSLSASPLIGETAKSRRRVSGGESHVVFGKNIPGEKEICDCAL
jgi:hypothetical protein